MKTVVIVLAVVLAALAVLFGVLYYQTDQARIAQSKVLLTTQHQLTDSSNHVAAVEATVVEMTTVKKQLTTHVTELEQSLTTLGNDKSKVEDRAKELQARIETIEKELADEKAKLKAVEEERAQTIEKLTAVAAQLVTVREQLADLQKKHAGTEAELAALRAQELALEAERKFLEQRLHDIDELRAIIRADERRQWEQHISEWKKIDADAATIGNHGILMKDGKWQN